MRFLYNLGLSILFVVYLPTFIARWRESRRGVRGFSARLGIFPKAVRERLGPNRPVWLQAVSVGEVLCLQKLVSRFRETFAGRPLAISTTTVTGQKLARDLVKEGDTAFYFPLDLTPVVRRAVQVVRPKLFILVETEIWPGLVGELKRNGIPVVLINGRISDRSYARYPLLARFLKPTLGQIDRFLMQTDRDAQRIITLGAPRDRVRVVGNLKYDNVLGAAALERPDPVCDQLKRLWPKARICVAGSIHPGEETVVMDAYRRLSNEMTDLSIVLAPRHLRHVPRIEGLLKAKGISSVRWSHCRKGSVNGARALVVDTLGELVSFYRAARVVFVGGTLVPKGGQNPIEAAQFSKPILYWPYVSNFQDAFDRLKRGGGGFPTHAGAFEETLRGLFRDPVRLDEAGARARKAVEEAGGACERTLTELKEWLRE